MSNHKQCPIAIFYRAGFTSLTPSTLDKLLPTFKQYGYKSFAVDMSSGTSSALAKEHQKIANSYKKVIDDILEVNAFTSEEKLSALSHLFKMTTPPATEAERLETINEIKTSLTDMYHSSANMAKLFTDLTKSNIKYAPLSKESINILKDTGYEYIAPVIKFFTGCYSYFTGAEDPIALLNRDISEFQHIIEKIQSTCYQDHSPIVAYIGLSHFKVADALRAEGTQVQEFYIVDYPADFSQYQGNGIDGKLRTGVYDHSIKIIDTYTNPNLNPLSIVKYSLIDYSNYNELDL